VLEIRPGAGGAVGMSALAKAAPDGYTIGATSGSMLIATPMLTEGLSFTAADFAFVSLLANVPFVLTVPASSPVRTAAELLAYVRANKGKLSYGSVAVGHYAHVAMQEVSEAQGADMVHVPYKGEALIVQDLLGGRLQLGFFSSSTIKPQADGGKVRLLGVSGLKRLRNMPDVPTLAEQGWSAPVFRMNAGWLGVVAPAKTPAPVLQRLSAEYIAAMRDAEVNAQLSDAGLVPVGSTAEEFAAVYQSERNLWKGLLVKAGLQLKGAAA
jgi:tripartite-type tricarboxylate transporter receptor subunit TctC